MADERRPTRSLFWPILLIGIGVAFLLVNLDLIPRPNLFAVLRLWPLILVGIGLDLIFRRRYPFISLLIAVGVVVAAVVLIAFAPTLGIVADTELRTERVSEPVGVATSARVDLDLGRYRTTLDGLAGPRTLIEAELDTLDSVEFEVSGTIEKTISLRDKSDSGIRISFTDLLNDLASLNDLVSDASWEIHLNPDVPLDLNVDVASGSAALNLDNLTLTRLVVEGGSGNTAVNLPAVNSRYDAFIDGGSGSFAVAVADNAKIDAIFNVGSGSLTLAIGDAADVSVDIDGGSGGIRIEVPKQAAVRLVIRDGGLGSVRIPSRFDLIDDGGDRDSDTGIWETAGFDGAEHQIEIDFDPGSGSFAIN